MLRGVGYGKTCGLPDIGEMVSSSRARRKSLLARATASAADLPMMRAYHISALDRIAVYIVGLASIKSLTEYLTPVRAGTVAAMVKLVPVVAVTIFCSYAYGVVEPMESAGLVALPKRMTAPAKSVGNAVPLPVTVVVPVVVTVPWRQMLSNPMYFMGCGVYLYV